MTTERCNGARYTLPARLYLRRYLGTPSPIKFHGCTGTPMGRTTRPKAVVVRSRRVKERRRWPRLPLAIPVFVRGSDGQGKEILEFAAILNVSAGGVLLASRREVLQGSRISLEIPVGFPAAEEAAHAQRKFRARVLRTILMKGWYSCAVQFKSPLRVAGSERN